MFYNDPRVGFLSIHRYPFYPGSGAADETGTGAGLGTTRNVPLPASVRRQDYRAAFREGSGAAALSNYFVGQIVGTMNESKPAATVVFEMIDEFIEATQSLARQLDD